MKHAYTEPSCKLLESVWTLHLTIKEEMGAGVYRLMGTNKAGRLGMGMEPY